MATSVSALLPVKIERTDDAERAAIDGSRIKYQRCGVVDGDDAAGIADRGELIEGEHAEAEHFDDAGVGHRLRVQRIAGAADFDLAGIAERAVLHHGRAGKVDFAAIGHAAAVDGGAVERQLRRRIDGNMAGIGDIDQNVQRAAGNLDGSRNGIGNAALILEVAARRKLDGAGIQQNAVIDKLREAADADGSEVGDY